MCNSRNFFPASPQTNSPLKKRTQNFRVKPASIDFPQQLHEARHGRSSRRNETDFACRLNCVSPFTDDSHQTQPAPETGNNSLGGFLRADIKSKYEKQSQQKSIRLRSHTPLLSFIPANSSLKSTQKCSDSILIVLFGDECCSTQVCGSKHFGC